MGGLIFGTITTLFLMAMRMRFIWWVFHPAGFAVSSSWSMNVFWGSIFVSWLLKLILLKLGRYQNTSKGDPAISGIDFG